MGADAMSQWGDFEYRPRQNMRGIATAHTVIQSNTLTKVTPGVNGWLPDDPTHDFFASNDASMWTTSPSGMQVWNGWQVQVGPYDEFTKHSLVTYYTIILLDAHHVPQPTPVWPPGALDIQWQSEYYAEEYGDEDPYYADYPWGDVYYYNPTTFKLDVLNIYAQNQREPLADRNAFFDLAVTNELQVRVLPMSKIASFEPPSMYTLPGYTAGYHRRIDKTHYISPEEMASYPLLKSWATPNETRSDAWGNRRRGRYMYSMEDPAAYPDQTVSVPGSHFDSNNRCALILIDKFYTTRTSLGWANSDFDTRLWTSDFQATPIDGVDHETYEPVFEAHMYPAVYRFAFDDTPIMIQAEFVGGPPYYAGQEYKLRMRAFRGINPVRAYNWFVKWDDSQAGSVSGVSSQDDCWSLFDDWDPDENDYTGWIEFPKTYGGQYNIRKHTIKIQFDENEGLWDRVYLDLEITLSERPFIVAKPQRHSVVFNPRPALGQQQA